MATLESNSDNSDAAQTAKKLDASSSHIQPSMNTANEHGRSDHSGSTTSHADAADDANLVRSSSFQSLRSASSYRRSHGERRKSSPLMEKRGKLKDKIAVRFFLLFLNIIVVRLV